MKKNAFIGVVLIILSILYLIVGYSNRVSDIFFGLLIGAGIFLFFTQNIKVDSEKFLLMITPSFFTIIGIIIGNYVSTYSSEELYQTRHMQELREESYSKLMGLKNVFSQSLRTNLEAKILTEYYETRYLNFSKDPSDLAEAKKQYDRGLAIIPQISLYQKELFETLGKIKIAYNINKNFDEKINSLYNYLGADITFLDKSMIKTPINLEYYHKAAIKQVEDYLKREITDKFEELFPFLLKQIKH